jgi:hypothetical protein
LRTPPDALTHLRADDTAHQATSSTSPRPAQNRWTLYNPLAALATAAAPSVVTQQRRLDDNLDQRTAAWASSTTAAMNLDVRSPD